MARARRWWLAWVAAHVVVLCVGLASQLRLVTEPCPGCPAVFRLSSSQQRALEQAGGTLGQFRLLVALVILGFAVGTYWLAWVLVRRSKEETLPVVLGYLLVPVGTWRWIEDATILDVGGPISVLMRVAGVGNYVALLAIFALFPEGHWRPGWSRWAVAAVSCWAVLLFATPLLEDLTSGQEPLASIDAIIFMSGLVLSVVWQILRYRSGDPDVRAAVRWVAVALGGVLVVIVPLVLSVRLGGYTDPRLQTASIGLAVLGFYLVILAVAAAVVRHRLWDVDVIVNRVVVYGGLTLAILAFYVILVTLASGPARSYGAAVAAAVAVGAALLLQPLRRRLQGLADRLLFGERSEPAPLLRALAGQSQHEPAEVLSATAKTIAYSLKLPRVAISVDRPDGTSLGGIAGAEIGPSDLSLPLVVDTQSIGSISFTLRRGQRRFSRADRETLTAVAAQAGATAAMVRLALDLQRSRGELVTAREEERRRMSRDLHDGLGPTLAGVAHRLEHLRSRLPPELEEATGALSSAEADVRGAFDDVRRLVRGLRPPALDQLGLVGAIEAIAEDLGLTVDFVGEPPEHVTAAVELAAYRIASEALSNVRRHAGTDAARITIDVVDSSLIMEVADDGRGLPDKPSAGVGMQSMHERAAELGGSCQVRSNNGTGTLTSVRLPLMLHTTP